MAKRKSYWRDSKGRFTHKGTGHNVRVGGKGVRLPKGYGTTAQNTRTFGGAVRTGNLGRSLPASSIRAAQRGSSMTRRRIQEHLRKTGFKNLPRGG